MSVTRTLEINDLTPAELARLFADMDGRQQGEFFAEVWRIAKAWPGAGWCQQSYDIVRHGSSECRDAISTLAAHLDDEPAALLTARMGDRA